jgi:hypothetical protein
MTLVDKKTDQVNEKLTDRIAPLYLEKENSTLNGTSTLLSRFTVYDIYR